MSKDLKTLIRDVPDFPKKGIIFKDITTLLKDKDALKQVVDELSERYKGKGIEQVVAAEARGFILGAAVAYNINAGFVPVRKKGKLPAETLEYTYDLEYGTDTLAIHKDAISQGTKVLVLDDLLATGGTIGAICQMIEKLGGDITEICFMIELDFLKGREKLKNYPIFSLMHF